MPSVMARYYTFTPWATFNGSNAADVVSTFNAAPSQYTNGCTATLLGTSGTDATVRFGNVDGGGPGATNDIVMHSGDCIPLNSNPYPQPEGVMALYGTFISGQTPAAAVKYGGFGESTLGVLAVGSQNIAVTIKPTQPDTGYVASAFLDGPALALGTVSLGTPVKTSASVVTVPVINSGLLPVTLSTSTVSVNVTAPQS